MGKFQLNKKGEDPLKIYEDVFKIANDTVETHLGKLGKMPNPISSEGHELDDQSSDFQYHKADSSDLLRTDQRTRNPDGSISYNNKTGSDKQGQVGRADYKESKASETNYFHSLDASAEDILNKWLENQNESVTGEELPDYLWDEIEKTDGGSRLDSDDIQNYIDDYFNTDYEGESKASEARKLNARQKKLIEEWVGSMSSPPMMITSDDLPYSLLSELRDINDFDGFDSAIMRYASDIGNKQAMQGSNPYMHSSNYGSFESKANEGFIKDMNLNKDSLRNYDLDSLINMWKDAQAYYQNPDNTWEDEDAEFYDELAVVINEKKSSAGESEDVFMYDGTGDSDGVGYWWDFELPVDQTKHEQLSSILGIDINTAWGFMTPSEQDRVRNYKLNKSMTNEAQLMKEINDGWEFSVIDHGYGGGNKIDGVGNSPDVGLLEVGIFSPDTDPVMGVQKSAVQGYMTQADVDGLLSTFRTDPAVAFRSIGGEWTFDGQKGLEYQSHYSDMSDITWRDIETMEGSLTLLERNMWLENRFDEITSEDFRRLADTARDD